MRRTATRNDNEPSQLPPPSPLPYCRYGRMDGRRDGRTDGWTDGAADIVIRVLTIDFVFGIFIIIIVVIFFVVMKFFSGFHY